MIAQSTSVVALERLFGALFGQSQRTLLVGGAVEPFYRAGRDRSSPSIIFYTADFVQSALHEVAHWCIAGRARRMLDDYGYWYHPDGRDRLQQLAFEQVEVAPQALEWILSEAAGQPFRVSADNLNAGANGDDSFRQLVSQRAQRYIREGLPPRAAQLARALDNSARYVRLDTYLKPAPR